MVKVSSIYRRQRQAHRQDAGWLPALASMAAAGLMLAGCGELPNNAIDLYHNLAGGPIAAQRPPPPGADSPYPTIDTIPARPLPPDVAAQQRIGDSLAAQRDAAEAAAARDPLTTPPKPPATPKRPPADPNANKVMVDAAASPAAPIRAAPAVRTPASSAASTLGSVPALQPGVAAGPMPTLADAPPPPPVGLEPASPLPPAAASVTAPPVVPTLATPTLGTNGVAVAFTPGSTVLPPSATLRLRRFAQAHRGVPLAVTGHGDGGPADADAQSRALGLGLSRAAAIAASLGAAGITPANLRLRAEASGAASTASLPN